MAVYVDQLMKVRKQAGFCGWRWSESCHMIADTREELMEMAKRIGLKPSWIQKRGLPDEHFDLTRSKATLAVEAGAHEIDAKRLVGIISAKRRKHKEE